MSSHRHIPVRRALVAAAILTASAAALAGCGLLPTGGPAAKPVDFDDVQSATVYFKGQGTYIDPGTTGSSEVAWIGSGFLVTPDGLAMTNNHVVVGAGTLSGFIGGDPDKEVGVKVLGASECLDLAVVQLEGTGLPFLGWHQGDIKTGLDVYSAGYPLGAAEEFTLTRGIVSKNDFAFDTQWASLGHVIEHDARIRGGNSGGPLVDPEGAVVGINYAGDDSLDYNYAIHRDVARDAFEALSKGERVASIGINAKAWRSEDGSLAGVWVQSVEAGGPADVAGVEPGDLIYKLGGVSVGLDGTLADYCKVLDTQGVDATIDVDVYRPTQDAILSGQVNGKELQVTQTGVLGGDGGTANSGGFTTITGGRRAHLVQRRGVERPRGLPVVVHDLGRPARRDGGEPLARRRARDLRLLVPVLGAHLPRGLRRRLLRRRLQRVRLLGHLRARARDAGLRGERHPRAHRPVELRLREGHRALAAAEHLPARLTGVRAGSSEDRPRPDAPQHPSSTRTAGAPTTTGRLRSAR